MPDEDRVLGHDQADAGAQNRSSGSAGRSGTTTDATKAGVCLGGESSAVLAKAPFESELGTSNSTPTTAEPTSRLLRTLRPLRHLRGLLVELKRRSTIAKETT